jgi:hypothetical protein
MLDVIIRFYILYLIVCWEWKLVIIQFSMNIYIYIRSGS